MVNRARPKSRLNSFFGKRDSRNGLLAVVEIPVKAFARWEYSLQFFSVPLCLCGE